jgi:hypothetical protein
VQTSLPKFVKIRSSISEKKQAEELTVFLHCVLILCTFCKENVNKNTLNKKEMTDTTGNETHCSIPQLSELYHKFVKYFSG